MKGCNHEWGGLASDTNQFYVPIAAIIGLITAVVNLVASIEVSKKKKITARASDDLGSTIS